MLWNEFWYFLFRRAVNRPSNVVAIHGNNVHKWNRTYVNQQREDVEEKESKQKHWQQIRPFYRFTSWDIWFKNAFELRTVAGMLLLVDCVPHSLSFRWVNESWDVLLSQYQTKIRRIQTMVLRSARLKSHHF